ncbi:MAG: 5-oxoprolinase subunit PxpB [Candidatus Cryosericum sp.]
MTVTAAGDSCWLVVLGDGISPDLSDRVHTLRRALEELHPAWLVETVPGYCTLGLVTRPPVSQDVVEDLVQAALAQCTDRCEVPHRTVTVPVCYGGEFGPDLDDVAAHAGIAPEEVIRRHAASACSCAMVGFLPGFPYLTGLDPVLATPRRATPRISVPGGSVGVAGAQTGIYPTASPGGWNIIGRTPIVLFDPAQSSPALIQPGDRVQFAAVSPEEYSRIADDLVQPASAAGVPSDAGIQVLGPGFATTVQDGGRWGMQAQGIPVSGAMDPQALAIGNILVGNDPACTALEITLSGPTLLMETDALVALVGADMTFTLNDAPRPLWTSVPVHAGDTLSVGAITSTGCRAWLCFAGGIDVPSVLGSRSTLVRGSLGGLEGRPLRAGDRLVLGTPRGLVQDLEGFGCPPDLLTADNENPVPVLPGPQHDALSPAADSTFLKTAWTVTDLTDRMGCRLDGAQLDLVGGADIISEMVPPGAIQVTGAGQPVVLLADRQTTGGYVKPFVVATAALGRMAQLVPGDHVRFGVCTRGAALAMLARQETARERLITLRDAWRSRGTRGTLQLCVNGTQHVVQWQDITQQEADNGTDNRPQQ